jgi:hypothetical protein
MKKQRTDCCNPDCDREMDFERHSRFCRLHKGCETHADLVKDINRRFAKFYQKPDSMSAMASTADEGTK